MIPKSILDMINYANEKAYILTALEYIQKECKSHSEEYDENDFPIGCKNCPFYASDYSLDSCFFSDGYDSKIPEEWNLEELERKLKGEII